MPSRKPDSSAPPLSTRDRVLAAAERLLATGRPEFSMRDLAAEAGVSFATPFNQFGSKVAIMHALSTERIEAMHACLAAAPSSETGPTRILSAMEIAASVMLERPEVNRVVMGALGSPAAEPGHVLARSRALWTEAVDDASGFADPAQARALLPDQLAFVFRGVLSFWTAGEIADGDLVGSARRAAAAAMLGFAPPEARCALLATCSR